jgi:hypothetical protein
MLLEPRRENDLEGDEHGEDKPALESEKLQE